MPPEIQDNFGLICLVAVGIYAAWRWKNKKATQGQTAPQTVYVQSPAAPHPGLADQFIQYQDERERDVKRQLAMNKLDNMVLYEETLRKIAECVPKMPGGTDPK